MATKTSILVFYLRLAQNTQKILRLASWTVLIIVNIAGTILTFLNIFQCQPIHAAWDPTVESPQCIPLLTEFICSAPVNITTDLAILALPIPVLTGMRLPQRQKTILVITFALGIFVAVVDVIRIYYLQQAITVTTGSTGDSSALFGDSADFAWNASMSLMWSAVEVNVGITCACIPTLKPLIIRILPAMIVDPDRTRSHSRESQMVDTTTTPKQDSDSERPPLPVVPAPTAQPNPGEPEPPAAAAPPTSDGGMLLRDFLNSPESARPGPPLAASTFGTLRRNENAIYFGFVNMKRPKSMLRTSVKESWQYCTIVSFLFFLWGFSYGLLNTLNTVIGSVADMSDAQTIGLTCIYFGGGYFLGPLLVGEWILRHDEHHRLRRKSRINEPESIGGFKTTFIVGLLIYGTGTIMFWPSAVLESFPGFICSMFVVGFGLGVLETAANPFIALCGPNEYAEMRLLLAQGVQGLGSVFSGLLANNVFFKSLVDKADRNDNNTSGVLLDVQWTYLAVTLLSVLLALFFYYMPLPEVSDSALGRLAADLPVDPKKKLYGGLSLRTWAILLAVAAQWFYIACQEMMSIYFTDLLTAYAPPVPSGGDTSRPPGMALSNANYLVVAHTAFAVSRFVCGYLAYLVVKHPNNRFLPTPRTMLTVSAVLTMLFALLTVVIRPWGNPNLMFVPIVFFFLFEGPLWPLIFALGLRGQGRRTKRAAAWLTMGGSGPAFWPFVIYAIVNQGGSIQTAFILVVALLVFPLIYPMFLTFCKDAKAMVEPVEADGSHPRTGDTEFGGLSRTVTEPSLAQLMDRRRKSAGEEKDRRRSSLLEKLSQKGRHSLFRASTSGSPPRAEHRESAANPSGDDQEQEKLQPQDIGGPSSPRSNTTRSNTTATSDNSRAPWEDQALDTTILDDL